MRTISVHQTLHGYTDGHRLIAASTSLKGRDEKTMLILSDSSGPAARICDQGYLTGYPLPESGFYALGRTWSAPEKSRPGCVWTHTLLLEFSDLATLISTKTLLAYFQRPQAQDNFRARYSTPLKITCDGFTSLAELKEGSKAFLANILWGLYGNPKECLFLTEPTDLDFESLVLGIWNQQWPRLRRNFRFCTMAFADRSSEVAPFDLQIFPSHVRISRNRSAHSILTTSQLPEPWPDWLCSAINDLCGHKTGLRAFFHEIGGDVAGGRSAFASLCRLQLLFSHIHAQTSVIDEAISILKEKFREPEARLARAFLAKEAAHQIEFVSSGSLQFFLQHLDLLDRNSLNFPQIGRKIWLRDPTLACHVAHSNTIDNYAKSSFFANLSIDDMIYGLQQTLEPLVCLLNYRPDVVTYPEFWLLTGVATKDTFNVLAADKDLQSHAFQAILSSKSYTYIEKVVELIGPHSVILGFINYIDSLGLEELQGTELACKPYLLKHSSVIAEVLGSEVVQKRSSLVAIARATNPDTIQNAFGQDPWISAIQGATGDISDRGRIFFAAYLFARALGRHSLNPAYLFVLSFENLFWTALQSGLPDEARRLLDGYLPRPYFWASWDYCQRLKEAVVDSFVQRNLPYNLFLSIAVNDRLFEAIIKYTSFTTKGRSYLKGVLGYLKEGDKDAIRKPLIEGYL